MRPPRTPPSCAEQLDWREVSKEPPVPAQEAVAEEKGHHRHAAEEHSKRHLMTAQCDHGRCPCMFTSIARIFMMADDATARALHPHRKHRPNSEERSGEICSKDGEDSQLHPQKRANHSHQLYVAESHAFHAASAQINCSCPIDERRPNDRASTGFEQGE